MRDHNMIFLYVSVFMFTVLCMSISNGIVLVDDLSRVFNIITNIIPLLKLLQWKLHNNVQINSHNHNDHLYTCPSAVCTLVYIIQCTHALLQLLHKC